MEQINVEVAYATPSKQSIIALKVSPNATIIDAIYQSRIMNEFPQLLDKIFDCTTPIGIFGKKIDILTYQLRDRDRIEIYRPLSKTPNQRRLERAKNVNK